LQDLYKKVRGVLNKLTPQKFSTLVSQVQALPIDTMERLQGVINLVFEKVRLLGFETR
jgi:translation initiation factor 4G